MPLIVLLSFAFAGLLYWTARQLERDERREKMRAQLDSVLATAPVGLAFIQKPFSGAELTRHVEHVLGVGA